MYITLSDQPFVEQKQILKTKIGRQENHFRKARLFPIILVIGYFLYSIYSIVTYSILFHSISLDDHCSSFRWHVFAIIGVNLMQFFQSLLILASLYLRRVSFFIAAMSWTGVMITLRFLVLNMLSPASKIEIENLLCCEHTKFNWQLYIMNIIVHTSLDAIAFVLLLFMMKVTKNLLELNRQLEYYKM